jgi:AraC-like DNA-binding protein
MALNTQLPDMRDPHDVRTLSLTYYDGYHVPAHCHDWAQLIWARSGLMRVIVGCKVWHVPPTRAIWIPARAQHEFSVKGEVAFRTLYVAEKRSRSVTRELGALEVSALLAELILHILYEKMLDPNAARHDRLAGVLVDLIVAAPAIDLVLPLPADARALRLATHFQSCPDDNSVLPDLARKFGASVRTLQRCFVGETGMTIDAWRQKLRLIASTEFLANGCNVTESALRCGYDSPSAFIAAFKRNFGTTPRQFGSVR